MPQPGKLGATGTGLPGLGSSSHSRTQLTQVRGGLGSENLEKALDNRIRTVV